MLRLTAKSTDQRIERGLRIFNAGLVREIGQGCFVVKSESSSAHYIVRSDVGCNCPDAMQRSYLCKHAWGAFAGAAMTIQRLQMADSRIEVEQLCSLDLMTLPNGIARTVMLEAYRAIERVNP
jgi:hypothetical protein